MTTEDVAVEATVVPDETAEDHPELAGAQGPPILAPSMPSEEKSWLGRVRLGRWFAVGGLVLAVLMIAALAQSGYAIYRQNLVRDMVINRAVPAALMQPQLSGSIGLQDDAIRQYAATRDPADLAQYRKLIADQARTSADMRRLLGKVSGAEQARADVTALDNAAAAWRARYAEPVAVAVRQGSKQATPPYSEQPFAQIRATNATLQRDIAASYHRLATKLRARTVAVYWSLGLAALATVVSAIGLAWLLRWAVLRPLSSLATNVRAVAQGDLVHPLDIRGAPEFVDLATIVDAMRHRIMEEWRFTSEARGQLDDQATELRRSNAELEQFAYVASHDLQEPLRKVASFCQMLERKYSDQLDDRGRQYIDFAVDGAKRMQVLINDLLSFSRVGRLERPETSVSMRSALERAMFSLSQLREDTGAEVTSDELPELRGDQTQFTQLMQNLIGNSIKFHGDDPPRVHIGARRDGDMWEFSCSDNGIGIEAKYADRIFLIFQRLHPQDVYTGTGIGLAMCKKIVEHHGGRIWLETSAPDEDHPGTTIRWTLPAGDTDD
jgi:signal transduction histidine kinase